jgi:hypothetical protein
MRERNLENASHGQADCLAFFICPWCVPPTGKENASNVSSVASISTSQPSKTAERGSPRRQPPLDSSLFHLTTPEASAWVEENVTAEAQFFGTALVVEPRYVADLIHGMHEAGLEVR